MLVVVCISNCLYRIDHIKLLNMLYVCHVFSSYMYLQTKHTCTRKWKTVVCKLNPIRYRVFVTVDSCVPGDSVTVAGVVKVLSNADDNHRKHKDKSMFLLYVNANSVTNTKGDSSNKTKTGVNVDFTVKELYAIEEIQEQENLFRLIVASVCPAIYGHEMVKAGLILALFGGTHKYENDKNRIPVRGDPHVLVVGDPGLGKSQMLHAMANVAPRSVYVCGNTTTTSGLTVTLTKVRSHTKSNHTVIRTSKCSYPFALNKN